MNYISVIKDIDLTEMFSHNIIHTLFVELYLSDPFAFKMLLGNWVVRVWWGQEEERMERSKNKQYFT